MALRIEGEESRAGGVGDASLGDEAGDQAGGGDVESVVGGGGPGRADADGGGFPGGFVPAGDMGDLVGAALLDDDFLHAVADGPVQGGGRENGVERHAVVTGGKGLQIGADFVGDVAGGGAAVAADQHNVHHPVLHQVAAGVVGNQGVGHAVVAQFPCRQGGALVARAGFVHPDVDGKTGVMGGIDGSQGGAVVHERQPAGVAMREHVDRLPVIARGDLAQKGHAMLAHAAAEFGILVGDGLGFGPGGFQPVAGGGAGGQGPLHAVKGPFQVPGGGAGGQQGIGVRLQAGMPIGLSGMKTGGQIEAPGGGAADESGPAQIHVADGRAHVGGRAQVQEGEFVGQAGLVNDAHASGRFEPDGAVVLAGDVHGTVFRANRGEGQAPGGIGVDGRWAAGWNGSTPVPVRGILGPGWRDCEIADDGMVFRKQIEKTPDGVVGAPKWGGWSRDSLSAVTLVEAEPRPGGFPKTDHEKS